MIVKKFSHLSVMLVTLQRNCLLAHPNLSGDLNEPVIFKVGKHCSNLSVVPRRLILLADILCEV